MSQRSLADLLGDASVWRSAKIATAPNPSTTISTPGASGKFVMIRIEGAQYLNLAEVKVHSMHDDYAAATIGQLKTVSAPFWDRLSQQRFLGSSPRPWTPTTADDQDLAIANLGQLKKAFSFDPWIDQNNNGIPDTWEQNNDLWGGGGGGGTPPLEPDADEDGDGLSNYAEYNSGTDPRNTDSDGDGSNDAGDSFPNDDRRSGYIPVKYYGVIDLSEHEAGGPVDLVTIDDSNQVAWHSTLPGVGNAPGTHYVVVWRDGAASTTSFVETYDETQMPYTGPTGTVYSAKRLETKTYEALALSATGKLGGIYSLSVQLWPFYQRGDVYNDSVASASESLGFTFAGGTPTIINPLQPYPGSSVSNYPQIPSMIPLSLSVYSISSTGTLFGTSEQYDPQTYETTDHVFLETPAATDPKEVGSRSTPISNSGIVAYLGEGGIKVWDGSTAPAALPGSANDTPSGVNDLKQVVGTKGEFSASHPLGSGFFYDGTTKHTFQDILPEKFKKQIRSAVPYLITNVDPATNQPTITFSAEALEGEDTWVSNLFRWTKNAGGKTAVERLHFRAEILMEPTTGNRGGAYAGRRSSTGSSTSSTPAPASAAGIKFAPAVEQNAAGTLKLEALSINWGFDAPTPGDNPNGASTGTGETENPMWWTSVAKAGEYNINQTVKVVFDSDEQAKNYQIVVPDASAPLIDVIAVGGGSMTAPVKETKLKITGKAGSGLLNAQDALVHITPKGKPAQVTTKLTVRVLPERKVKVGIWRVEDPTTTVTIVDGKKVHTRKTKLPEWLPSDADVIKRLKQVYRQACITVEQDIQAGHCTPPGSVNFVECDISGNGKLEFATRAPFGPEYDVLKNAPMGAPLNLVFLADTSLMASGVYPNDGNKIFVFGNRFSPDNTTKPHPLLIPDTCAHEMGHALQVSTRNANSTDYLRKNHDSGPWPDGVEQAPIGGIMNAPRFGRAMWLRYEDWNKANAEGRNYP